MARGTPRGDAGRQGFDSADRHGGDLCFPSRTDCVQGNRCHEDGLRPRVPEQRRTAAGTARTSVVPDGCERHRRSDARPGIFYPPPPPPFCIPNRAARAARPPPPSRRRRDLTRTRVPIVLRSTAARPILNRGTVTVLPVFPPSQFSCHRQSHPSEARGSRRPGLPRLELAHTRRALREGGCEEALAAPRSPRAAAPSPVVGRPGHSPAYRGDTVPAVNRNLTSGTMKVHRNLDFVFRLITIDIISITCVIVVS